MFPIGKLSKAWELLAARADPTLRNKLGCTALEVAEDSRRRVLRRCQSHGVLPGNDSWEYVTEGVKI